MRRAAILVVALLALLAAGCGTSDSGTSTSKIDGGAPDAPLQAANGPVAPAAATSPLTLALTGAPDPVQIRFGHQPRSGLLFDLDTGRVLWRKDPTRILPIASVTKIMTALVVADRVPQGSKVRITKEALAYQGSGVGVLPKNKWIGVSAMLYGLLLPSGNDAAIALAQRAGKTVPGFVAMMNARASSMGLSCTRYSTPSGFTDRGNHSCAADLAVEARALLDEPRLAKIVGHRQAILPFPIKGGKLYLYNHNPLLLQRYPGTLGVKTGFTDAAGRCLVAAVKRDGHRLGVVLLHSPDPGGQAEKLFDRGFRAIS
ncbi:MAG: D-alanyl-D-alanine carboxypeptidase [Conexibacter sp.]|nr:D-alanyl-D-alanine carboxypeptidase [Conexibacter sp.]